MFNFLCVHDILWWSFEASLKSFDWKQINCATEIFIYYIRYIHIFIWGKHFGWHIPMAECLCFCCHRQLVVGSNGETVMPGVLCHHAGPLRLNRAGRGHPLSTAVPLVCTETRQSVHPRAPPLCKSHDQSAFRCPLDLVEHSSWSVGFLILRTRRLVSVRSIALKEKLILKQNLLLNKIKEVKCKYPLPCYWGHYFRDTPAIMSRWCIMMLTVFWYPRSLLWIQIDFKVQHFLESSQLIPAIKCNATVSNHGQGCSLYIVPVHSALWMRPVCRYGWYLCTDNPFVLIAEWLNSSLRSHRYDVR